MTVKVVPLPVLPNEGLKFDLILESMHVVTISMSVYEVRHYRSATIADVIEQKVLDWLFQNDYSTDELQIIFL